MRKIIYGFAGALIAISSGATAAVPAWRVSEVSGDVRLSENGRSRAALRGALLTSGATIATGPRSRAVIVRGEEFVVISPATQLRVPAADTPNTIMQMIEDFGTAVFRIQKKSTPHFGVQTPYLAAVVKGTTFAITVGPEGGTVQVTEGAVEVSTLDGGAADLITAGTIATVGASDLYKLTIDGVVEKVIRSESAPASGTVSSKDPSPAAASYSGPVVAPTQIGALVSETQQSLSDVTGGLIAGEVAIEVASNTQSGAVVSETQRSLSDVTGGRVAGEAAIEMASAAAMDHGRDVAAGKNDGTAAPADRGNGNPARTDIGSGGSPSIDPSIGNSPPVDPGNGIGNGPPADPGSGIGNGPPVDPGNGIGDGPPADPSSGIGNGPPVDPGNGIGNGPPADLGSGIGSGPPVDPGNAIGNSPPADTGSGIGSGPPADPGSDIGNGPPADPGNGIDSGPPADPGSDIGSGPPADPGNAGLIGVVQDVLDGAGAALPPLSPTP